MSSSSDADADPGPDSDPEQSNATPDVDPDPPSEPIVESSTIRNADITIHAHPWQTPVDVETETVDVQILAESVTLNGVEYMSPTRALHLTNVSVTHNPRKGSVEIRTS